MKKIYGYHPVESVLRQKTIRAGTLYLASDSGRARRIADSARAAGIRLNRCTRSELDGMISGGIHNGVILVYEEIIREKNCRPSLDQLIESENESVLIVVLDEITDPHNLGAVLRSADLFGVDAVVLPGRRTARENETVTKTSSGASLYVAVHTVPNLARFLDRCKENRFWVFGADITGIPVHKADFGGRTVIVMGREGAGLHALVRKKCDSLVAIPSGGHVDSFNVAVAAGIVLYEIRRRCDFQFAGRKEMAAMPPDIST